MLILLFTGEHHLTWETEGTSDEGKDLVIAVLDLFRKCGIGDEIIIKSNVSCNTDGEYHKKNFGEHFRDIIKGELPSFWKYLWDGAHLIQTVEFDSRFSSLFFWRNIKICSKLCSKFKMGKAYQIQQNYQLEITSIKNLKKISQFSETKFIKHAVDTFNSLICNYYGINKYFMKDDDDLSPLESQYCHFFKKNELFHWIRTKLY